MRTERAPLAGREHIMFRSFYQPVSNTIDGDLCEQSRPGTATGYAQPSMETQSGIARQLRPCCPTSGGVVQGSLWA